MKLADLYAEYFANWISNGSMISRDKISLLGIRPLYDRYLTSQYITKVWAICALPVHYDKNLTHLIRTEMYEAFPEVSTIVHLYNKPVNVGIFSNNFKRHMSHSATQFYRYKDLFESLSEVEQETGVYERNANGVKFTIDRGNLEKIQDSYDSYMYVYKAVSSGKTFTNTYYFVQASGKSRKTMQKYDKKLMQMLRGEGIIVQRLRGNVGQYLDNFCPASFLQGDVKRFRTMLFSQENTAGLMPKYTRGLVSKRGIYVGLDWMTKLPFSLDLTTSGTAQVILINGKSGCGKTYLSFEIALELASFGVHCSVTDIKGGEWSRVLKYTKGIEIDMAGETSRFVNLMRLDNMGCTRKNSIEAYEMAVNDTVGLFEVATSLQENEGNASDLYGILSQAVEKVYSMSGVLKNNPRTFEKTKTFTYDMVVDVLSTLEHSKSYTDDQKRLCRLARTRCATFFVGEGRCSAALENELTLADVLDAPLVIYNFNKNTGNALEIIDDIRVFMVRCLDGRKHFMRKQKGLHQAAFYEELQRCGGMKTFIRNISANVTGSRSNNLSVFLLMNAIGTMNAEDFAAIKSNITTRIIGKCNGDDIEALAAHYDCAGIRGYMESINRDVQGNLSHCFAVSYDVGNDRNTLILKSVLPDEMLKTFSTRDFLDVG